MSERHALKLCYVEGEWAYFTTQPLDQQWGDDWEDAPFEHNAGAPYRYDLHDAKRGEAPWRIVKVAWDGYLESPAEFSRALNSPWCVRDINAGAVSWLQSPPWADERILIPAGVCLCTFARLVRQAGGTVYYPAECPPCAAIDDPAEESEP